ncbi:MAG: 3-deoxy-8-phosphooctulonate synthase [Legionellales bacterium]|jgi:2-dehydro-3-deoxyphosphooctonate aldolase (KDO 8-P synthase)|nr:3-deoxy-8-phosphooctulonate synthase [Legionellales bacterium]
MNCCGFKVGLGGELFIIAGPCVVESEAITMQIAEKLKEVTTSLGVNFIFKASIDKANRTSVDSFRGLGYDMGLEVLAKVKRELGVPILTDIHTPESVNSIAEVVDVLQIPAFLCRQTDLVVNAAATMLPLNIKKGQFLSPWDMKNVLDKAYSVGNKNIMLTERGTTFGYNNLVVDMRSLAIMQNLGAPVIFDMTHSVQLPGAGGSKSSGQREFIPTLSRAAVAAGIDGLFFETHPNPANALSDGPNSIPLHKARDQLEILLRIHEQVQVREKYQLESC